MTNDIENLFMYLWAHYISSFVNYLFKFFAHYFYWVVFLLLIIGGSVNILDTSSLSDISEYCYC